MHGLIPALAASGELRLPGRGAPVHLSITLTRGVLPFSDEVSFPALAATGRRDSTRFAANRGEEARGQREVHRSLISGHFSATLPGGGPALAAREGQRSTQ